MIKLRVVVVILLMLSLPSIARAQALAPLASGGAPPCPEHNGVREFHSALARDGGVSAFIVGIAGRDASGCHRSAEIHLEQPPRVKSFSLSDADREDFEIVDFSPDGSKLLLAAQSNETYPNEQYRDVQITSMPTSSGEMRWQNVWDLLAWKDCDATVEPQGFTADGKLLILARPSVMSPPRRSSCVSEMHLYTIGEAPEVAAQADIATITKHYGKVVDPPSQTCQSDPDLIGSCFTVQGKVSAWNGAPTYRISLAEKHRILGVTQRPLPASVPEVLPRQLAEKMNSEVEASGDFLVCPFTTEKPGRMQMVCVQSARNVTFKPR